MRTARPAGAGCLLLARSPDACWLHGCHQGRPRDQRWEVDEPRYRVHFHEPSGTSDEYVLAGADAGEVLAWAHAERGDRTFVLYVCVPGEASGRDGLGLVRLTGADPNAAPAA